MNFLRKPFRYQYFNATLTIIVITVAAHLLLSYLGINRLIFGLNVAGFVYNHFIWQPFTYLFVHGDFTHLFFNMLALLIFGIQLEKALGSKEFILLYFVTGVLSGLFSILIYFLLGKMELSHGFQPSFFYVSLIGASGAIYAILFAFAVFFPRSKIFIWGIIPLPAPVMVLVYAVIEFLSQFSMANNVAHMTHLAGFAFAWLYFILRMGIHPLRIWKDAYRN